MSGSHETPRTASRKATHDVAHRSGLRRVLTIRLEEHRPFSWLFMLFRRRRERAQDVIAASTLPESVKVVIREVTRRSRLWRGERGEVARELCAHFEDGIDAGRSPEKLIESFGDVDTAARLIRRAKKRQRSIIWQTWRRGWQAVGVLVLSMVVVYIYAAVRMFAASPSPTHDYLADLNRAPAAVPAEERAWPLYREALLMLGFGDRAEDRPALPDHAMRPVDEGWPAAVAHLTEHQDAVALLREAAGRRGLGYVGASGYHEADLPLLDQTAEASVADASADGEKAGAIYRVQLPHLAWLRLASGVLYTDAFRAAEAGDGDTMVADLVAMIRAAEHPREMPILINDLVGVAILHRGLNAVAMLLEAHPELFSDDDLVRLAHVLGSYSGGGEIELSLAGERMFFADLVQRVYSEGGAVTDEGLKLLRELRAISHETGVWPRDSEWAETLASPVMAFVLADREEMVRRQDALMDDVEAAASRPLWRRNGSAWNDRLAAMRASTLQTARYWPVVMLTPAVAKASESAEIVTQLRDGVLVGLALELHRRRHGEWPNSLEAMTPNLLPDVPLDRFTGEPLGYRIEDGRPLVYGVGTDLDDDGGVPLEYPPHAMPDGLAAARWLPPERVAELKQSPRYTPGDRSAAAILPDADWILWPPSAQRQSSR